MKLSHSDKFLWSARKKFSRRSHYVLWSSEEKNSKEFIGKLRKTSGSNYVLYDHELSPKKTKNDDELRSELMSIDAYSERQNEILLRRFDIIIPGS